MPSRQDQLHSYQFSVQRVVAALVMRETDPPQSPFRRVAGATLAGVLVTALAVAAFAVWGLLQPGGSTRWRTGDAVIVERETGATYVYLRGRLHPVLNYASALLIVGSSNPRTVSVPQRSLAGAARGVPLGIAGAPDSLPARGSLVGGPWSVCSRVPADAPAPASMLVGGAAVGGTALGAAGLLVGTPDGAVYLIWHSLKLLVREPDVLLGVLVWSGHRPLSVAPAFLNALPAGGDIARIQVPDRGHPFPSVPGARVGQVFVVGDRQHAVALADGLAPVTAFQAALLLGDPRTVELVGQKAATPLSPGEYAAARKTRLPGPAGAPLPPEVPRLMAADPAAPVCTTVGADVRVGASPPGDPRRTVGRTPAGGVLVDEVHLPGGRGAVVEALPAPDAPSGTLHVITDAGVRHPVPSSDVLAMLGYSATAPTRLPVEVVALLPAGAALDPQAARSPAAG